MHTKEKTKTKDNIDKTKKIKSQIVQDIQPNKDKAKGDEKK